MARLIWPYNRQWLPGSASLQSLKDQPVLLVFDSSECNLAGRITRWKRRASTTAYADCSRRISVRREPVFPVGQSFYRVTLIMASA